jgi:hypothetical protein
METEINEAFEYLDRSPGILSLIERELIKKLKKSWKEQKTLSEGDQRTLFMIKQYRESADKHLY